ncbi:hypothetical protein HanRHA438_Chr15g0691351 [Helianthus annuus]|nr:hypothetical protein HanRHA438_Chr15g0691351 [Helianthus annuus]
MNSVRDYGPFAVVKRLPLRPYNGCERPINATQRFNGCKRSGYQLRLRPVRSR